MTQFEKCQFEVGDKIIRKTFLGGTRFTISRVSKKYAWFFVNEHAENKIGREYTIAGDDKEIWVTQYPREKWSQTQWYLAEKAAKS